MPRRLIPAFFFVALFGIVHAGTPPELVELQTTYALLLAARVTAPYESGLESLNTKFVAALASARDEAMKNGKLPDVLAIDEDKERMADKQPLPENDDAKTPASLKKLREVYREQLKKLLQQRTVSHADLMPAYTVKLQALESTLTKAARLEEAKEVMQYRESLGTALLPAPVGKEFTNSLGMKFVEVPGTNVLFCIHETRYKDYVVYAAQNHTVNFEWKNQKHDGHEITDRNGEHPVVDVSWDDSQKFCSWLSKKEGKNYRLPTDEEWSIAVGLGAKEEHGDDITPAMLSEKESTRFPWGGDYPPRSKDKAGNYSDESRRAKVPRVDATYIDGYDDDFPTTAPTMSFRANKFGLYDMAGNVWEWCEDWYDDTKRDRVMRGGAWFSSVRQHVLSSFRFHGPPMFRGNCSDFGFRCVLEKEMP